MNNTERGKHIGILQNPRPTQIYGEALRERGFTTINLQPRGRRPTRFAIPPDLILMDEKSMVDTPPHIPVVITGAGTDIDMWYAKEKKNVVGYIAYKDFLDEELKHTPPLSKIAEYVAAYIDKVFKSQISNETSPKHIEEVVTAGDFMLTTQRNKLAIGERMVDLTTIEANIIKKLLENPDTDIAAELLAKAGKNDPQARLNEHTLRTHMHNIRAKLEEKSRHIRTTFKGRAYRFESEI